MTCQYGEKIKIIQYRIIFMIEHWYTYTILFFSGVTILHIWKDYIQLYIYMFFISNILLNIINNPIFYKLLPFRLPNFESRPFFFAIQGAVFQ